MEEALHNAAFRRRLSAALAAGKGPDAVAAIVDRRLAALERARSFIEWEGAKAFAEDLAAMLAIVTGELGKTDPDAAIDRILRFLATAGRVFDRVDDSGARVQNVFHLAADALPGLAAGLSAKRKANLLDRLHPFLVDDDHAFGEALPETLFLLLPPESIDRWDERLAEEMHALSAGKPRKDDWLFRTKRHRLVRLRQAIADYRGDCDAFIALERESATRPPDALAIAERLLTAGRRDAARVHRPASETG